MSNWALTRLFNVSFIALYVAGLLWEEHRRPAEPAGGGPDTDQTMEGKAQSLPIIKWAGVLLLAGCL